MRPNFNYRGNRSQTSRSFINNSYTRRRPRILVIDDDAVIAETLMIILELAGFEAMRARGVFSGLHLAWSWRPDILLTDFDMPDLNGVDVAKRICTTIPDCRPFLLSGHLDAAAVVAGAREEGYPIELIKKPIHPAELLRHLATVVSSRKLHSRWTETMVDRF